MRRSHDRQPSFGEDLKGRALKAGAAMLIGISAVTGCGTNEANAGSPEAPTTTTTVENEEKSVSVAELDGSERVPYTYSSVYSEEERRNTWGPGTPKEFNDVSTIDDLVGTTDEIADELKISAELSPEEFAKKFIDNTNYVSRLSTKSNEEFNLLPTGYAIERIFDSNWDDDLFSRNDVLYAIGDHYYEASGVMFADDASETANNMRSRLFKNSAMNSLSLSSQTDNKYEKKGSDPNLKMYCKWNEFNGLVSYEKTEENGTTKEYITFRWLAFDNRDLNTVEDDPNDPELRVTNLQKSIDKNAPDSHLINQHETTLVVHTTDDGRYVIEGLNDVIVEDGQEVVK